MENKLMKFIESFMLDGCSEFWFDSCSSELQYLNFAVFVIPCCVKNCFDSMVKINNNILEKLSNGNSNKLNDHNLLMWMTSFAAIYQEEKNIDEHQCKMISHCLWHSNDQIRITAYKFICDNYSQQISEQPNLNIANILDVFCNNLTSDNPGFRNHMISATKRLFISIRDSTVTHLSNTLSLFASISEVKQRIDVLYCDRVIHLETIQWAKEIEDFKHLPHRDIAFLIVFSRFIFTNRWFHLSTNYQRQRSLIDLSIIIRDVLIDSNFIIDKKCGFGNKTVLALREFFRQVKERYFDELRNVLKIIIDSIKITKADVQNSLFTLLTSTYKDCSCEDKNSLDLDGLWKQTKILCNSNQPIQLNAGSLFCSFLSHCDYQIIDNGIDINEYLVVFLEHLASIDMSSVLKMSLKTPGHGFLMTIDSLLRQNIDKSILKSERVPIAGMKIVKLMMQTMGCEANDLASFHKMGITMNSLATNNDSIQSINMNVEYQHVLSWTWQILKNATSMLVSWCQAVVKEIHSPIFREIGVLMLRILCQSRHRGTIECVAGFLQIYLQLGKSNGYKDNWLTAHEVAIDECIEGAVRGKYSITRRSAGLPLVLMSALNSSNDTSSGCILASECLIKLMKLSNAEEIGEIDGWCDPPIVHYLNLMKQMCNNPILQSPLQRYYGNVILIALHKFSSNNWGVRNAALQLFNAMLSRVVSASKGVASNPTFSEIFSMYPELWNPILAVIEQASSSDKSFMKHQTLVPALTFMSSIEYCSDKQMPCGMRLNDFLKNLWPLLNSQVISVRYLTAKCIVNSLPYSSLAFDIIKLNTLLIPYILDDNLNNKNVSKIRFNQQHGELYLLNLIVKKFKLIHQQPNLSFENIIQYVNILKEKHCWVLIDSVVSILLNINIQETENNYLKIFFENLFQHVVKLLFHNGIGQLNLLISILKFISSIEPIDNSLRRYLLNSSHSDIFQHIILDYYNLSNSQNFIPLFFKEDIELLLQIVNRSIIDYKSHYSPYIIQILCVVIDHYPEISVNYNQVTDLLENLHKSISNPILSEISIVCCQKILSWLYTKINVTINTEYLNQWMIQIDRYIDCYSLESTRMSAAKDMFMMITSSCFDKIIFCQADKLAIIMTFGCFDENKPIREIFRSILHYCNHFNTSNFSNTILTQNDFILFYRMLGDRSKFSKTSILINLWKVLIAKQSDFLNLIRQNQAKDALYEPVPGNIYIEYSMILEVIYRELRRDFFNKNENLICIENLHRNDLTENELVTNLPATLLSLSGDFLSKLH